mgnify:CR=1 FL=1
MDRMHDWTLTSVCFDWHRASASLEFVDAEAKKRTLTAEQVRLLEGPSVSVNEASEAAGPADDGRILRIEMQSGDVIRVWAAKLQMP